MNAALLKRNFHVLWKLLAFFTLVLFMYFGVIVAMYDPAMGRILDQMAAFMPGLFAAFGMQSIGGGLTDFLITYLYGFLLLLVPMVYIVIAANMLVARHVDSGAMAYLLAAPVSRRTLAATQAATLMGGVLAMDVLCCLFGLFCAHIAYPGEMNNGGYFAANAGLLGLHLFMAGYCFLCSCAFNESKHAIALGAGVLGVEYLLQMAVNMGQDMAFLRYATVFTLYDAPALSRGDAQAAWGAGILAIAGLLLFIAGGAVFRRRNLPL